MVLHYKSYILPDESTDFLNSSLESGMIYPLFLIPTLGITIASLQPWGDMTPMLTQVVVRIFYRSTYPSETGFFRELHRPSSSSESPSGLVLKMFKIL
jgi:hypothetical protein